MKRVILKIGKMLAPQTFKVYRYKNSNIVTLESKNYIGQFNLNTKDGYISTYNTSTNPYDLFSKFESEKIILNMNQLNAIRDSISLLRITPKIAFAI